MFLIIFFLTLATIFSLSLWASISTFKSQSIQNSLLSSRSVTLPALTLTFVATQLGGSAIIASSTAAMQYGHEALLYTTGLSLGFLIHSLGFGRKMREAQVSTISELFEKYYASSLLRTLSSFVVITSLFLILTSIAVGSWTFMQSMGIQSRLPFYCLWAIMIAYTSMGGLNAVIKTDMIQVCFVLGIFSMISIFFLFEPTTLSLGGISNILQSHGLDTQRTMKWLIMPTLFTLIGQDMGQRCFAAHDAKTVTQATFLASLIMFFAGTIPVGLALMAKHHNPQAVYFIDLLSFLKGNSLVLGAFFAAATATAVISTADSLLCALGSSLAFDLISPCCPNLSEKKLKNISTLSIFLIGITAIILSLFFQDMMALVITSYSISVILLSAPIICAIIFGHFPKSTALTSILLSISVYTIGYYFNILFYDMYALLSSIMPFIFYTIFNTFKPKGES